MIAFSSHNMCIKFIFAAVLCLSAAAWCKIPTSVATVFQMQITDVAAAQHDGACMHIKNLIIEEREDSCGGEPAVAAVEFQNRY